MQAVQSFAPLAARLAARADEIRPVDGAEANWANFMALFVCAIFQMLILLCEALDARAVAVARLAAAPRECNARPGVAARADRATLPVAGRAPWLALVPDVHAILPQQDAALPGTGAPLGIAARAPLGPWLAWSRHAGPAWAVAGRIAIPPKNAVWRPGIKHTYIITIT